MIKSSITFNTSPASHPHSLKRERSGASLYTTNSLEALSKPNISAINHQPTFTT